MRNKFTSDEAKKEHRRGGRIVLGEKQLSVAYLMLLENITGKNKKALSMEFYRNGLKTSNMDDIEIYLRGRAVIDLPKKVKRVDGITQTPKNDVVGITEKKDKEVRVEAKPKVDMAAIMAKVEKSLSEPKPVVYQKKLPPPEYDPFDDWAEPINR